MDDKEEEEELEPTPDFVKSAGGIVPDEDDHVTDIDGHVADDDSIAGGEITDDDGNVRITDLEDEEDAEDIDEVDKRDLW